MQVCVCVCDAVTSLAMRECVVIGVGMCAGRNNGEVHAEKMVLLAQ